MTKEEIRIIQRVIEHMAQALKEIGRLAEGKIVTEDDAYRLTISKKAKTDG